MIVIRTVIIGLGNPILRDDSVGVAVARQLAGRVGQTGAVEIREVYAGGLRLLDALIGFDRAIIIDAIVTKENLPGRVHRLTVDDVQTTWNSVSVHDMNLPTALAMGAMLDLHLPDRIDLWGIEGADMESFGESLTVEVARAVPLVVNAIAGDIAQWMECTYSIGA
jgi:hydrogenase maturation protease